jgi:hypothetical protein
MRYKTLCVIFNSTASNLKLTGMKLKLLVFLLLAATCSFAQGRSPELLAKVNTKMEWHKKKAKRLFVRKLAWYYKNELKGKYGRDILKKLVLYPIDIRMRFPQRFTLDTGNIYKGSISHMLHTIMS